MLNERRVSFLKKSKMSTQSLVGRTNYPKIIQDEDMKLLWTTFIKSPSFKDLSSSWPKDPISFNYNSCIAWYSFLKNNHYEESKIDFIQDYQADILACVKKHITRSLHNLRAYKVVPLLKVSEVSYQLYLPPKTTESKRVNCHNGAKIKILLTYVPQKSRMIDLSIKEGPKLSSSSIDKALPGMQGYLYRELPEYLKYKKNVSADMLIKIPEYQWYLKEGLRFRHNGNSLALMFTYDYPGVIPMTDSAGLLKEFDKIMSTALRAI